MRAWTMPVVPTTRAPGFELRNTGREDARFVTIHVPDGVTSAGALEHQVVRAGASVRFTLIETAGNEADLTVTWLRADSKTGTWTGVLPS